MEDFTSILEGTMQINLYNEKFLSLKKKHINAKHNLNNIRLVIITIRK